MELVFIPMQIILFWEITFLFPLDDYAIHTLEWPSLLPLFLSICFTIPLTDVH